MLYSGSYLATTFYIRFKVTNSTAENSRENLPHFCQIKWISQFPNKFVLFLKNTKIRNIVIAIIERYNNPIRKNTNRLFLTDDYIA